MSAALAVNQPAVSSDGDNGMASRMKLSPGLSRKPYKPQNEAGTRTEPPVSVPMANGTTPAATMAAEPLLDPPVRRSGKSGCGQSP
jgi:hypothetical protein